MSKIDDQKPKNSSIVTNTSNKNSSLRKKKQIIEKNPQITHLTVEQLEALASEYINEIKGNQERKKQITSTESEKPIDYYQLSPYAEPIDESNFKEITYAPSIPESTIPEVIKKTKSFSLPKILTKYIVNNRSVNQDTQSIKPQRESFLNMETPIKPISSKTPNNQVSKNQKNNPLPSKSKPFNFSLKKKFSEGISKLKKAIGKKTNSRSL